MICIYGENITRNDLYDIPLVRPERAGNRWRGIQHGELVDTIASEVESRGWSITDQQYSVQRDGGDLVGAFQLDVVEVDAPEGQELSLGFVHSNLMSKALRLYVGSVVRICHNGLTTGSILMSRMHTHRLDLRAELSGALDQYVTQAMQIVDIEPRMRERNLRDVEWDQILVAAARQKYLSWSAIGKVDHEYHEPRHEEHGHGTSWTGLQAFTEVVKQAPVHRQMDSINGFRQLLPVASRALSISVPALDLHT